jgi:putative membrane protein
LAVQAAAALPQEYPVIWIKALHVAFMVTWFAGLFYLPRLFVYHAATDDAPGIARFKTMERKLFAIMTIGAVLTTIFGVWILVVNPALLSLEWMKLKIALVVFLFGYHFYCWKLVQVFAANRNRRSHVWYRWFNEIPSLLLLAIVLLAVVKPF